MSGVVSHGPANLYDSSGHALVSVPISTGGGGSSYVLAVAVVDSCGTQLAGLGSTTVSVSSGTITLSSAPSVTVASILSSVGTPTSITASSSVQTILSSNASRLGATIYNQSNESLYLLLSSTSTPASTATFTLAMVGLSYFEVPYSYVGSITGLWSPSSGSARVTELS